MWPMAFSDRARGINPLALMFRHNYLSLGCLFVPSHLHLVLFSLIKASQLRSAASRFLHFKSNFCEMLPRDYPLEGSIAKQKVKLDRRNVREGCPGCELGEDQGCRSNACFRSEMLVYDPDFIIFSPTNHSVGARLFAPRERRQLSSSASLLVIMFITVYDLPADVELIPKISI
jgi:hypothetical protein